MFSMIVELPMANKISSRDGNSEGLTYQRTLFPAPAIAGGGGVSHCESVGIGGLTFPMNPYEGTWSR